MNEFARGLLMRGAIIGRTKRTIGKDNERIVVTYRINDGNTDFFVDEWSPTEFYSIGDLVCLPVYVKIYSRNGINQINYAVKSHSAVMAGEEF